MVYNQYKEYTDLTHHRDHLQNELRYLEVKIQDFEDAPENNRFISEDEATMFLENKFLDRAGDACRGPHNCGPDFYQQECFIQGTPYIFTLELEYNRHDKTYYYIEESKFHLRPKIDSDLILEIRTKYPDEKLKIILDEYERLTNGNN